MKILLLTKKFPYPLKDGESIAVHGLSKSLTDLSCEITLLSLNTDKHYFELKNLPKEKNHFADIKTVEIKTEISSKGALKNLFSDQSYHLSRFDSKEFGSVLKDMLTNHNYDIIQLETLTMALYIDIIKSCTETPIVMRAHNVEHQIWERLIHNMPFGAKKMYLKHLTKKLKNFEKNRLQSYDLLLTVSDQDKIQFEEMGYSKAIHTIPIGIDLENYQFQPKTQNSESLFFIGSMDWMPNKFGVQWFLENVWIDIFPLEPQLQFHLAGRNMEKMQIAKYEKLVMHGEVDSAIKFMSTYDIMIVPLFSGSGTRVKIIEGLALGKIIITTAIGTEGIAVKDKEHVLIANTAAEFKEAILFCRNNQKAMEQISMNARRFIEQNYNQKKIAKFLFESYTSLIQSKVKY